MSERILLLLPSLTALGGGIEQHDRHLVEAIARVRPDAELACVLARESVLRRPELLSADVRARLRIAGSDASGRLQRISQMLLEAARLTAALRPTLVVCGHVNFAVLAQLLARVSGARSMAMLHGIEAWSVRGGIARRALGAMDLIVSVSSFTAAQAMRTLGVDGSRLAVLANAVDLVRFSPGAPSDAIVRKLSHLRRPRLLTVSRLDAGERYKGIDQVIRVLATMDSDRPAYLVVGDGTDRPRLQELAQSLGVSVEFYGHAPDAELADLYRACDLFIMPSRNEGFGYVFIEAMACGLPVIAGGVDGSVDAVAGGELGRLVNPFDLDEIGAAIRRQLDGAPMRSGSWLHAEVTARFGLDQFDRRVDRLLDRIGLGAL